MIVTEKMGNGRVRVRGTVVGSAFSLWREKVKKKIAVNIFFALAAALARLHLPFTPPLERQLVRLILDGHL